MKNDPHIVIAYHSREERQRNQERTALKVEMLIQERQALARKAVDSALRQRETIQKAMTLGKGVWWEELAPLDPKERGIVIAELRKLFGLKAP